HGVNSQYNYTLSKCEDYNSDNTRGRNNFPQANNPYDPAANKGPCSFDRRHNFNVAGTYAFPESSALGPISRGWAVGTVVTALSGEPFTPNIGSRDRSGQYQRSQRRVRDDRIDARRGCRQSGHRAGRPACDAVGGESDLLVAGGWGLAESCKVLSVLE